MKNIFSLIACNLLLTALFAQDIEWEKMWAPVKIYVAEQGIKFIDNDQYAGSQQNGVYKYNTNDESWEQKNNGLISTSVLSNHGTSYADFLTGTTEGLYKYNSGNEYWERIGIDGQIWCIASNYNFSDDIFVGANDYIYRYDNNASWDTIKIVGINYETIVIQQLLISDSGVIMAHVSINGWAGMSIRSIDNGLNWEYSTLNGWVSCFTKNSAGHLFAGIHGIGILISTDEGFSWEIFDETLPYVGWPELYIDIDDNIYMGDTDGNLRYYMAGENTGVNISNGIKPGEIKSIGKDEQNKLVFGTDVSGFFESTNQGETWKQINKGLKLETDTYLIYTDNKGTVFAGTIFSGIDMYLPYEPNPYWEQLITVGQGFTKLELAINNNGDMFLAYVSEFTTLTKLYRKMEASTIWEEIGQELPNFPLIPVFGDIAINNENTVYIIITYAEYDLYGIYYSEDNGETWQLTEENLYDYNLFSLCTDMNNNLYAGTNQGIILRSSDNGNSWETIITDLHGDVTNMKSNAYGVYALCSFGDELVLIHNNGATENVNLTSINSSITSFDIDTNNVLYIGTSEDGIFKTTDNGKNWISLNGNIEDLSVRALTHTSDNYIYCSTSNGSGIFRTFLDPNTDVEEYNSTPIENAIQIYPNPVSNIASIKFTLTNSSFTNLTIYNSSGSLVRELNEFYQKGNNKIYFDASLLISGLYFVKFTNGMSTISKKLIVL